MFRVGETPRSQQKKTATGLLHTASDRQLQVDLDKRLKFPQHITATSLRPNMMITSEASKHLLMLELTVPWAEHIEKANERKCARHQELVEKCREWRTFYEPTEVDHRGFAGRSLCKVLGQLATTGAAKKRAIQSAIEPSEKATRWLWLRRADSWVPTGMQVGV